MEPSDKIRNVFKLCSFKDININLDESLCRNTNEIKGEPNISIGNNNYQTIINELKEEGSSKINWNFSGNISSTIIECFNFMGYIVKVETKGNKGFFSLIIDENDFFISSNDLLDLNSITEDSSSDNEEIIIHINNEYKDFTVAVEYDTSDNEIEAEYKEIDIKNESVSLDILDSTDNEEDEGDVDDEEEDVDDEEDGDEEDVEDEEDEEDELEDVDNMYISDDETVCLPNCNCINCLEEKNDL